MRAIATGYTVHIQMSPLERGAALPSRRTDGRIGFMADTDDRLLESRVRDLERRYADAVDSRRMDAWLDCFTEDGSYYVIAADNESDDLPLCLMMDDCRERLEDRATFVRDIWPGSFEDYQTRHFIQPLRLEPEPGAQTGSGMLRAVANFTVFATDARGRTSLFIAGQYRDRIRVNGGGCRYVERRVVMDTFTTPGVVVYPL